MNTFVSYPPCPVSFSFSLQHLSSVRHSRALKRMPDARIYKVWTVVYMPSSLDLRSALTNERYCAENITLATFNYTEIKEREDMSREGFKANGACTGTSACGPPLQSGPLAQDAHTRVLTAAPAARRQETTGKIPAHPSHRAQCSC